MHKLIVFLIIFCVLLMSAISYITARYIDHEEIARAKNEMLRMKASRDSIQALVAMKDSMQTQLKEQVRTLQDQADVLRNQVDLLEEQRKEQQLSVRNLRKKQDLQNKFQETFPAIAHSDWGVTEVVNEDTGLGIEYLMVPLWFSETFIIDHQNALSYKQQRDKLEQVDSLQQHTIALKDSILVLESEKRMAYQDGYYDAYAKYENLNSKYIDLLEKPPQVNLFSDWKLPVVGAAAGFIGGYCLTPKE